MSMRLGMNMFLWTTHVTEEHFPVFEELRDKRLPVFRMRRLVTRFIFPRWNPKQ